MSVRSAISGKDVGVLEHPVDRGGERLDVGGEWGNHLDLVFTQADGTPLRLYTSDHVKIDVSKRRKHDMGFWHRNIDAHEIIFCVKGALKWETEMGVRIMHPGDMLLIPRGIGHRSMLCEDSTDDNVLIELKISDPLTYVGENK